MLADDIVDKLRILPVDKLRSHEETVPQNLQRLRESMLNMGRLVDPLIVDGKHNIVIDGNHRRAVLDQIGCPNAACQLIEYDNPSIGVGGWYPVSRSARHDGINGFKPEKVDFGTGVSEIARMKATFMYMRKANGSRECYLYDSNEQNMQGVIAQQRRFISELEGSDVQYVADDKHEDYLNAGYGVFYRRCYTKEEIVAEALAGREMPPKSTRHTIPDRIIRLNLHLGWLSEPADTAKQMMDEMLRKRLNEGSIRRYTEPVIVLY